MNTLCENLANRMYELESSGADIEQAVLFNTDGLVLYSTFQQIVTKDQLNRSTGLLIAASTLADSLIDGVAHQKLEHIYFECEYGYVIVIPLYNETTLLVLARKAAKLGLIFLDINRIFMAHLPEPILLSL